MPIEYKNIEICSIGDFLRRRMNIGYVSCSILLYQASLALETP